MCHPSGRRRGVLLREAFKIIHSCCLPLKVFSFLANSSSVWFGVVFRRPPLICARFRCCMETVALSGAHTLLFDMSKLEATDAPNSSVEVVAVASTEAAAFHPPSLFQHAASQPGNSSSAQPSQGGGDPAADQQQQQQQQLNPSPVPTLQEHRTIFVAGFPLDMTEREFHCLLTFLPGYEACQLSWGTGAPQGFALFKCNADAVNAVDRLAGHQVEVGAVLRAELAHKNLVIKVRAGRQVQAVASSGSSQTRGGTLVARAEAAHACNA